MSNIVPCGHRILVRPDKYEETDPVYKQAKLAGLKLIEDNREQAGVVTGTVLAIGPTAWKDFDVSGVVNTPWAKVGDRIYYAKYSGKNIEIEKNDPLIVLNDEDVVAVVQ